MFGGVPDILIGVWVFLGACMRSLSGSMWLFSVVQDWLGYPGDWFEVLLLVAGGRLVGF